MKTSHYLLSLLALLYLPLLLQGQSAIPLGSWRTHFSYQRIYSLALTEERLYAASDNGFFYIDREDNSLQELSSMQGLSDAGVEEVAYDQASGSLFIIYGNANIDIIQQGKVYNVKALQNAPLPGKRKIYSTLFYGPHAYIATDYGISVINLQKRELQESFYNLGPNGEPVEVYDLVVSGDSLFAATEKGLMAGALQGSNLANFSSWRHFTAQEIQANGPVRSLAASGETVYAAVERGALLRYASGSWQATSFTTEEGFRSLHWNPENRELLVLTETAVYRYQPGEDRSLPISSPLIQSPYEVGIDKGGTLWVADGENGLLRGKIEGPLQAFVPSGPLADRPVKLYASPNGEVVAIFSRYRKDNFQTDSRSGFSVFTEGKWQNYRPGITAGMPAVQDFTDVVFNPLNGRYYFSTRTHGLLEWDPPAGQFRHFQAGIAGVSLEAAGEETPVTTLGVDAAGQVWMTQPLTSVPLHRFNPQDGSWQGYFQGNAKIGNAVELLVLSDNAKWLRLPGEGGILVVNEETAETRLLGIKTDRGGFSSSKVTAMALDLEYQLWIGFKQGVNYIANPFSVLAGNKVNAALPVYDRRALLNAEEVTALGVDGGNRKWIGTPNGQWVFGDFGDTLYHHFTTANSPLPDNFISGIAIQQESGEVFMATGKGIISYRSGATAAAFVHAERIKVYPNPVHPGFEGQVGITGLARDAIVKITDTSGRLVKELAAEGGTAAWDLSDRQGRRSATGVYLIFSATADGVETLVGKLAVIN